MDRDTAATTKPITALKHSFCGLTEDLNFHLKVNCNGPWDFSLP